ncbi:MAG TPA: hypothetical protein DD412_05435 [Holosporales bacterium]|nr:hypothetical protein [Holosporales bacterium]
MIYKTKLMSVTTLAALIAIPSISKGEDYFKTGFVAGASLGYSRMKTDTTKNTFLANGFDDLSKRTASRNGILGHVFGGYRYLTSAGFAIGFNLGFALDSNETKGNDRLNGVNTVVKLNRKYQVIPAIFVGQKVSDQWMIFTELAAPISRFKLSNSATEVDTDVHSTKQYTKVGFAPTIGAEYAMNSNLSVIGTLGYEFFGTKKADLGDLIEGQPVTENHVKVRPHYFTAKVGVLYKF